MKADSKAETVDGGEGDERQMCESRRSGRRSVGGSPTESEERTTR